MAERTHYPTYNILAEQEHWDDHTRSIVLARTIREHEYAYLSLVEAESVRALSQVLVHDERAEVIQYVVCHIDETLAKAVGEGQRKVGIPKAEVLVRDGLRMLESLCMTHYMKPFPELSKEDQQQIVEDLSQGMMKVLNEPDHVAFPQKAFFQKLMNLTVEAYCSHPTVWSEMGYGGPAYPRGYVRTDGNQLDPWEAKKEP
jgi:hypothetical protein